jgi:hypothetical protein
LKIPGKQGRTLYTHNNLTCLLGLDAAVSKRCRTPTLQDGLILPGSSVASSMLSFAQMLITRKFSFVNDPEDVAKWLLSRGTNELEAAPDDIEVQIAAVVMRKFPAWLKCQVRHLCASRFKVQLFKWNIGLKVLGGMQNSML